MSKQKAIIFFTILVDAIGIGIVIPVLPFYVASFGSSAFLVTSLFAIFSLFSFLSTPLLGALSDKYGRRPVLIVSIFSTSLGWFVFAGAFHTIFLFVGRIIDGIAAGNFSTAQSCLIDIAKNPKEKTHNIGLAGAAFGLGFILGPMLGGFLSPISPSFPFWFVGFLALANGGLAVFLLNESNPKVLANSSKKTKFSIKELTNKESLKDFNPFLPIYRAIKNKPFYGNFSVWFLFNLAFASMQAIIALYVASIFGFGSVIVGLFMAFIGIIIVLNQAFFLKGFWLKYFSEKKLEFWLFPVFGLGFLLMVMPVLLWFIIGLVLLTFSQAVLRVVITSNASNKSQTDNQGELMGVLSSLGAVASIVGPLIAGAMFEIKVSFPLFLSASYGFLAFLILLSIYSKTKKHQYAK
ncbi:MAG: MFS transporter [Candidatus Pacebacteria bacterium]|nr:MFS transporter [Candidatus Paceibacterota bacterium]